MPTVADVLQWGEEKTNIGKMLEAEMKNGTEEKMDYKAKDAKMFAHMDVMSERIAGNQAETARIRAETRVMLDSMIADMKIT